MVSSTTIDGLKSRERGGSLRHVSVNSGDKQITVSRADWGTSLQKKACEIGLAGCIDFLFVSPQRRTEMKPGWH